VQRAAVVVRKDAAGQSQLVAYVAAVADAAPVGGFELRRFLQERLPEHMVPAAVVVLESLPLTPSGKLDRGRLPVPAASVDEGRSFVAPRDATEEIVCAAWAEVLAVPRVGASDNFFDLGGHSLLATQLVSRLEGLLGVEVPLAAIFKAPIAAEFARELERLRSEPRAAAIPPLLPVDREAFRVGQSPLTVAPKRPFVRPPLKDEVSS
jgi:acyl carrier protein